LGEKIVLQMAQQCANRALAIPDKPGKDKSTAGGRIFSADAVSSVDMRGVADYFCPARRLLVSEKEKRLST
jgi:hypothetical protein